MPSDSRAMLRLERFAYTPRATFGHLHLLGHDALELFTVERPWLENQNRVSCIPEGLYQVRLDFFHRGGYPAYELRDVPGRSRILVHIGNVSSDVEGCIALGSALGVVKGDWGVVSSRSAFARFMEAMAGRSGAIAIHQVAPAVLASRPLPGAED